MLLLGSVLLVAHIGDGCAACQDWVKFKYTVVVLVMVFVRFFKICNSLKKFVLYINCFYHHEKKMVLNAY